ncbi:hypothetical protein LINPERPRIM_LOCUS20252 [Linum perenne]
MERSKHLGRVRVGPRCVTGYSRTT